MPSVFSGRKRIDRRSSGKHEVRGDSKKCTLETQPHRDRNKNHTKVIFTPRAFSRMPEVQDEDLSSFFQVGISKTKWSKNYEKNQKDLIFFFFF